MGGVFRDRKREPAVKVEIAQGFRLVPRLNVPFLYAFINFDQPFIARVDGSFIGRFEIKLSPYFYSPLAWSSDGCSLFAGGRNGALYQLDCASGEATMLHRSGGDGIGFLSCSPDGLRIAFVDTLKRDGASRFCVMDLETSAVRVIHQSIGGHRCCDLDWRRGQAAFISEDNRLLLVDLEGRAETLTDLAHSDSTTHPLYMAKFPFGSTLLRRDGKGALFRSFGAVEAVSPDGDRIAYVHKEAELRVSPISRPEEHERLAWMPGRQFHVTRYAVFPTNTGWSPDGRIIACQLNKLVRRSKMTSDGRAMVDANPEWFASPEQQRQFFFKTTATKLVFVDLQAREVAVTEPRGIGIAIAPASSRGATTFSSPRR